MKTLQASLDNGNPDSVARGWRRWVRARDAAYAKPNTKAAKLYFARLEHAEKCNQDYVRLLRIERYDGTTDFYLCSDFCAAMQAQLDSATLGADLGDVWNFYSVNADDLHRAITCHVCRRKVRKDGTTDSTHRVDFRDPKQVMTDVPRRTARERWVPGTRIESVPREWKPAPMIVTPPTRTSYVIYMTREENKAVTAFLEAYRTI